MILELKLKIFQKTNDEINIEKIMKNHICEITQGIKTGSPAPDAKWFKGESIEYVKKNIKEKFTNI